VKWWAVGLHDVYFHRRAVNETDQEFSHIHVKTDVEGEP
jgi:hypothetical protein